MANTGNKNYPADINSFFGMIEPIARQELEGARLNNPLTDQDAFYFYDLREETGQTIESTIIEAAKARGFDPKGDPTFSPNDPTAYTRYFSEWKDKQFATTVRKVDVRKVIAGKGVGENDIIFAITNSLSMGDNGADFDERRKLLFESPVFDYAAINGGKTPKTMKGVLHAARDMFNHLIGKNDDLTAEKYVYNVPRDDVRIAMSNKLLNLIDVSELAHVFNMEKEEIFGKLVVCNVDDLPASEWYKIVAYDRKALCVAEFLYEYSQDIIGEKLYTNHFLTVSRQYFYNALFKACAIDCSVAAETASGELYDNQTTFTVTNTLNSKATNENTAAKVGKNMTYQGKLIPAAGQTLSGLNVTVNMGGDVSASAYDAATGVISIPAVTGNVTITVSA